MSAAALRSRYHAVTNEYGVAVQPATLVGTRWLALADKFIREAPPRAHVTVPIQRLVKTTHGYQLVPRGELVAAPDHEPRPPTESGKVAFRSGLLVDSFLVGGSRASHG